MGLKVTLWSIKMSQAQSIVLGLNMLVLIKYTLKLDEMIEGFKVVIFLLYSKIDWRWSYFLMKDELGKCQCTEMLDG